jgi:hypothetical protein
MESGGQQHVTLPQKIKREKAAEEREKDELRKQEEERIR